MHFRFVVVLCLSAVLVKVTDGQIERWGPKLSLNPEATPSEGSDAEEPKSAKILQFLPRSASDDEDELVEDASEEKAPAEILPISPFKGLPQQPPVTDGSPDTPIFAKMILGDPANPKLASVEQLKNLNVRHLEIYFEPANEDTIPILKELVDRTKRLLRIFHVIQQESNGFVEDLNDHFEHKRYNYIGYYN